MIYKRKNNIIRNIQNIKFLNSAINQGQIGLKLIFIIKPNEVINPHMIVITASSSLKICSSFLFFVILI
jgi:hypothetical protein